MALYFGTTEITGIDNLVPQIGLDITDMWFGSTNVYTVWQTYEGTLPATINANGDDMRQYQIYGDTGGVGEPTENMFDESKAGMIRFSNIAVELRYGINFGILPAGAYTISFNHVGSQKLIFTTHYNDNYFNEDITNKNPYTFTTQGNMEIIIRTQIDKLTTFARAGFTNIMLTEGSTVPVSFVPYGYKLDMVSMAENLFDKNSEKVSGYIDNSGNIIQGGSLVWTYDYFPIIGGEEYTYISYDVQSEAYRTIRVAWYTENKTFISRTFVINNAAVARTVTAPSTAAYARLSIDNDVYDVMFNSGLTALPYQPYSDTTTSIYIGSDQLDKDEYVDYQAQKVYRMINGTLTPTDPPVPLPALPACEGTTIVGYAGESQATPEKVLLKYRKENF